jgi:hypothetical protein
MQVDVDADTVDEGVGALGSLGPRGPGHASEEHQVHQQQPPNQKPT